MKLDVNKKISFNTSHSSVETLQERLICKYHSLAAEYPESITKQMIFGVGAQELRYFIGPCNSPGERAAIVRAEGPALLDNVALWFHLELVKRWLMASGATPGAARPVMDVFIVDRTDEGWGIRMEGIFWLPSHWDAIDDEWGRTSAWHVLWSENPLAEFAFILDLDDVDREVADITGAAARMSGECAWSQLYRSLEGDLMGDRLS
ncbi:hypothetical protein [Chelatococcus asaccharovorans]|uniref:Uncharacterized protein n=1 Tax=Chelatococcus asaccharovorans TaxID=28210 RepID=A0A2V3TRZ5_9HYPH|nr:hypothetical protein [Chelatococcus asaccharovorans]MBS7707820.1 hypothetical protein [Chelatococcus asaccharovorans]PXW50936.1 hypothetical protein C7450_12247 [Chelatococcus asaccharovorans]